MSRDELAASVAQMIAASDLTLEEVAEHLDGTATRQTRTLTKFIEEVEATLSKNSWRGYKTHLERLRDGFGPQCTCTCGACLDSFDEHKDCRAGCATCDKRDFQAMGDLTISARSFGRTKIEPLCELAERHAVKRALLANRSRARRGLDPVPAHGRGAREMCASALKCLFQRAIDDGLISTNPAASIPKPKRSASKRRSLTATELCELFDTVIAGGDDPELDLLIVWADLELGSRRAGLLTLTVGALHDDSCIIDLFEKNHIKRSQPATADLIAELRAHAIRRGGPRCDPEHDDYQPDAPVLYYRDSTPYRPHPLGRRRFETLHTRIQQSLGWAREMLFSGHAIRHTSGTMIERIASRAVAQLHLGHAPLGTTDIYTTASREEHAIAFSELTGTQHPLAALARTDDGRRDRTSASRRQSASIAAREVEGDRRS